MLTHTSRWCLISQVRRGAGREPSLAHQVFVSYATEDADTASRVCALLEADGIQCWVAPRDVKAGTDYAAAIMSAIRNSQLVRPDLLHPLQRLPVCPS